ncbi:L,D-transpeptidase family protein [Thalassospira australica]|uniref:L,D-transpeptidase family protein n=1 Tax=Thalassospira australica TaxID=1528106 RepID=UPI00384E2623
MAKPSHANDITENDLELFNIHVATQSDTLIELARHYRLGYIELLAANPGVDPWLPGAGTPITLPNLHLLPDAPHEGIVINLSEQRLYFYQSNGEVLTMAIGIGRFAWETPTGSTRVTRKRKNPTWFPPPSIRAENPTLPASIGPGPNNPLGEYALDLGWPGYLIHGTNKPHSIGRRATHGCVRLYPEDIEILFDLVDIGTPVHIVDQPVKAAWIGDDLYLEIHPDQQQSDDIENERPARSANADALTLAISNALLRKDIVGGMLDWSQIYDIANEIRGIPTKIFTAPSPKAR